MVHKFVIDQIIEKPFEIGEEVICIDDDFDNNADFFYQELPRRGVSYTVRDCFPLKGMTAIVLNEITNKPLDVPQFNPEYSLSFEPSFSAKRFTNEKDIIFGVDVS